MTRTLLMMLVAGSMAIGGCTQSTVDLDAERAALRAAADAYHAAAGAADTDTVVSLYTSDAVILPPDEEGLSGPEAMGEYAAAFTSVPGFGMRFENVTTEVGAGVDMGYTLADAIVSMEGPGGEPMEVTMRDFHLWKKDGGEWKIAVDIWNMPAPVAAASSGPLEGAWVATSVTDADGNTNEEPQASLYVFTGTHYSIMFASGDGPRPVTAGDEMTDAEKIVAYDNFVANSGRYEIDGNLLKTRARVARSPDYMAQWPDNEVTYEFELDGDSLRLTNRGFAPGTVTMLRRVEGLPPPWLNE